MPTLNEYYALQRQRPETGGDDVEVVPEFDRGRVFGVHDRSEPTLSQMRKHNVSIFAEAIQLRAERLAGAITGLMPGQSGFDVLRNQAAELEPVEKDHPWQELIHRPNPGWSAFRFWRWMSLVKDLQGHAEAVIERGSAGIPTAMWPVYPEWGRVKKVLGGKGQVDHYVYDSHQGGTPRRIEPENILRLEHPDPVSGGQTASLLERGVYEITSEVESKQYEKSFLEDGRPPNVYIKLDQDGDLSVSSREQDEEASERMQQGYMGTRSNRVPILRSGEFATVNVNPDDLQMLESREMRKDDIFTITGIPPAMMAKDPTNANVEAAEKMFAKYTLQPLAIDTASTITQMFERAFQAEQGMLQIQAPNVVPTDEDEQETINQKRMQRGVPPADIMEEQGEEIPEEQEEELRKSYVPKSLVPIGDKGLGSVPTAPPSNGEEEEDRGAWDLM